MYNAPRIVKMLAPEKRQKVFALPSFYSIIVNWDHIFVILKKDCPYFEVDALTMQELGFSQMAYTKNKFLIY